jgi:coenzyme F420 hydrogenase subunit beta
MLKPRSLEDVVGCGLCTGCGLCESLGGTELPMVLTEQGNLRPSLPERLDPALEKSILDSCPGLNQIGPTGPADPLWGPSAGTFLGHSVDPNVRHIGSSGGATTAAALYLLETGAADAVLHVSPDPEWPMRSSAKVSRTRQDVLEGVGARYGPAAPLKQLHGLLRSGKRFVVVGKPCDIAAIRNLARHDPRVDAQLVAAISFFCAGLPSHEVSQNIISKYGLAEQDVSLLRYRGYGCPGPTRVETYDERSFEQTYNETWANELNQGIQFRCKICPDSTGEQADLVCCDAWEGGEGYPLGNGEGFNAIIARTEVGRRILDAMRESGAMAVEPLARERLATMQPHHARRKSQIVPRLIGMILAGQPIPRYRRLNLFRAALHSWQHAASNVRGMMRRLARHNNRETVPRHARAATPSPRRETGPST